MSKKMLSRLFAVFSLLLGIIFGANVYAESNEVTSSIVLSPMNQRIILVPGETYVGSIDISNPNSSTQNLHYTAQIDSFSQDSDTKDAKGEVGSSERTNYNIMMDWIVLDKTSGMVAPNSTDKLVFRINVPEDAPAGGQYATILIQNMDDSNPSTGANTFQIKGNIQMASIIYAEVAGETREAGKITENNIPSFLFDGKLEATSMVRNDGNVHTDAEYIFQVWPMFSDEEICTNEESVKTSLVMPETERYHTETCNLPAVGIFRAKQTVKIFGEESIVEKTVIVCPLWLIAIIIFVIVALIVWIVIRMKSHKKNQ